METDGNLYVADLMDSWFFAVDLITFFLSYTCFFSCFLVSIYSIWFYDKNDCHRIAKLMAK